MSFPGTRRIGDINDRIPTRQAAYAKRKKGTADVHTYLVVVVVQCGIVGVVGQQWTVTSKRKFTGNGKWLYKESPVC